MSRKPCVHRVIHDFKVDGLWRCSGCGRVEAWGPEWSYFGQLFCKKCHSEPAVEFVACSDACRRRFDPEHREVSLDRERLTAPVVLSGLDAKIEATVKRLASLRGERERVRGELG